MRKLSKKISMLMVLAMLVGLFSGVVSASAASAWSFGSSKYAVAVNGSINMESKEYADFDLLKDGKEAAGYTVAWASSDEDVVWVNAKTGQLRANKFGVAEDGDKAVISATFTNNATKKSATRSFTIVLGAAKADFTVEAADATIALGEEVKFAPVVKNADGKAVKFATHKSYNGYFLDGKAIANPWTPEEAGEYTVTVAQFAKKADVADLAKAVRKDEVKVTVTVDADFDAKATGVKEITVYGDFAKDAKFTIKKGAQNVAFTTTIAEDGKSAELALKNKITKGDYVVTYGDAKVTLALEDEKVASIVVYENDGQIFVDPKTKKETYAHFDVFNQYDESVRKTFDIKWAHNLKSGDGSVSVNKKNGVITLKSDKVLDYNDIVVLTGVVSGVGYAESVTATMNIGLTNDASTAKVIGAVLEDSTEILSEIPASFQGGKYYLVFEMYDRAGYLMDFKAETAQSDLTFTSKNPLLASIDDEKTIKAEYIDGVKYGLIGITKGTQEEQLMKGGVADIQIISSKTGKQSEYALRIVSQQVLASFNVLEPDFIIPKNALYHSGASDVELAFEALDVEGNTITDFRALHKAVTFGSSSVELREQNDGSAKLFYNASAATPDKDYDYPVTFAAIVPGSAYSDSVSFYVKNGRTASVITGYTGATEVLEGDKLTIHFRDWQGWGRDGYLDFADQYDDKLMINDYLNGKLVAVKVLEGGDEFTIVADTASAVPTELTGDDAEYTFFNARMAEKSHLPWSKEYFEKGHAFELEADEDVTDTAKEFTVEFVLYDTVEKEFIGGSEQTVTFKVVDLSQCVDFTVSAEDALLANNSKDGVNANAKFHVNGVLANGHTVEVPSVIAKAAVSNAIVEYSYEMNEAVDEASKKGTLGGDTLVAAVSGDSLLFKDQSQKKADGSLADRKLTYDVTAKVYVKTEGGKELKGSAKTKVEVGEYDSHYVTLGTNGGWLGPQDHSWKNGNTEAYFRAASGIVTYSELMRFIDNRTNNYGDTAWGDNSNVTVTISKLLEGSMGLRSNDIELVKATHKSDRYATNDGKPNSDWAWNTDCIMIKNAEIGDTFVVTYEYDLAKHVINFTVGADTTAKFSGDKNLTYK